MQSPHFTDLNVNAKLEGVATFMLHGLQSNTDQIFQVFTLSHNFFLLTITTHPYQSLFFSFIFTTIFHHPLILIACSCPAAFPFTYSPSFPAIHTHTHCPFQSPSSSRSRSPSLTGQYYIFQSVLCMIWGVDEAISQLPSSASRSLPLLALLFNVSIWRKQTFNQTD